MLVRGSEVQDFLRCRTRWNWRWNDGYSRKTPNGKLFIGTLIHKFMEELYHTGSIMMGKAAMRKFYEETDATGMDAMELGNLWIMCEQVVDNYIEKWWRNDSKWEIVETEYEFKVELDDNITYTGTIDLIFKDELGRIWFVDHKTTTSLDKYDKNSLMDRQISRYWWALKKLGYEPYGFIYNIILKDYPVSPNVLKSGKLSTAKNQNTTYELYKAAIEEHGLNVEDYTDFLNYLKENPREYFRRVVVQRNEMELAHAMKDFYYTSKEMQQVTKLGSDYLYRNITSDCSWDCSFKEVCHASLDGSNVDQLLSTLYNKEEK